MSAEATERWCALTEAALRALEEGDAAGLLASVAERDVVLQELSASGSAATAETLRPLIDHDRALESGVRACLERTLGELADVRRARERLRRQRGRPLQPQLASRRA